MTIQETLEQETGPPVIVHESAWPDQLWALLRQILPPISAFLIGRGIIDDDTVGLIGATGVILVPIIIGQLKTRLRANQLAGLEKRVPDHLLTTKAKAAAK